MKSNRLLALIIADPGSYSPTALVQSIVAAGGLGTLKDPTIIGALDSLQSSYGSTQDQYPVSDAALFSLSRLAPANPELQAPLAATLKPMLAAADEETRRNAVLALANAENFDEETQTLAEPLLTSSDPMTRGAALTYFELTPGLGADRIDSIAALAKDSTPGVQLQAVATLAAAYLHDNEAGFAALDSIARDESAHKDVRAAARLALKGATAAK
jgi:hypothetical protein